MGGNRHQDSDIDLATANPALVLKAYFERAVPPHLRAPDYERQIAEWAAFCEQSSEMPATK